jgi:hypothetical protein
VSSVPARALLRSPFGLALPPAVFGTSRSGSGSDSGSVRASASDSGSDSASVRASASARASASVRASARASVSASARASAPYNPLDLRLSFCSFVSGRCRPHSRVRPRILPSLGSMSSVVGIVEWWSPIER